MILAKEGSVKPVMETKSRFLAALGMTRRPAGLFGVGDQQQAENQHQDCK